MSQGGSILFVIVGRNEPLFEAEFTNSNSNKPSSANNNSTNQQHQHDTAIRQNYFVLHSALDLVEKAAWTTSNMYLRVVDKVGFMGDFVLHKDHCELSRYLCAPPLLTSKLNKENSIAPNASHHYIQKQTISFI
jgi:Sedlin, N-terminal conserved region